MKFLLFSAVMRIYYDRLYDLLREAEFPEALVMNDKVEEFKARLKRV